MKLEGRSKIAQNSEIRMSRYMDTSSTTQMDKIMGKVEDPVLPLERNLYGHPLTGLLCERQFEEALFELGWEKIPNWECIIAHRKEGLVLSVYVDDINMAGKKQNMALMWKKLMKNVDINEPTSFLDHVYLGCTQRECKPNETIIEQKTKMFESRISAGATEKLPGRDGCVVLRHGRTCSKNVLNDTSKWQTRKWSNCAKFQALAWMIMNSSRKISNQLESCQKFAH